MASTERVTGTGRNRKGQLDPFTAEIMRGYLISTVQEMVETTVRAAYSTCFSEGLDFTCALFDTRARMISQASGMPTHLGALFEPLETLVNTYDSFAEGDVIVSNDPYSGGSHQADVLVARPMFLEGTMLGFAVNRGHWVDVGGMSPGGWSGTVRHVIQEGLIIPPAKLYKAGVLDREVRDFILKNVRIPHQCWGDLQAQIASNIVAERRLQELIRKYGLEIVMEGMEEALRYSQRRFARMLKPLPDGQWEGTEYMEEDGHGGGPYRIHVTLKKNGQWVSLDFEGSDPQVNGPVNCTFGETKAGAYTALLNVVDPYVPMNSGCIEAIEIKAPKGSIVNPVYPAPVFPTTGDPLFRVYEAIMKAIAQWLPERITAGGCGTMNDCTASGDDPERGGEFVWYYFRPGGTGARATKDGHNVNCEAMCNTKNESMEVWETRFPVRFEKFEMITDSGGPGKFRGGLGLTQQMRILQPTFITAAADRRKMPPWGIFGGKEGFSNKYTVIRDGKDWDFPSLYGILSFAKFSNLPLQTSDVFDISSAGGGGYGDPLERDPKLVAWDVLNGYISLEKASEGYGAWIDPQTGQADSVKTAKLRKRLKHEGGAEGS